MAKKAHYDEKRTDHDIDDHDDHDVDDHDDQDGQNDKPTLDRCAASQDGTEGEHQRAVVGSSPARRYHLCS